MPNPYQINHNVSASQPTSAQNGDEWWNSTTNKLYKYIVFSGVAPQWIEITTGNLLVNNTSASQAFRAGIQLAGANSGYVGLIAPSSAGSTTYTLPATDGAAGQALVTDGAGTLSWVTPASTGANVGNANTWTAQQTFQVTTLNPVRILASVPNKAKLYINGWSSSEIVLREQNYSYDVTVLGTAGSGTLYIGDMYGTALGMQVAVLSSNVLYVSGKTGTSVGSGASNTTRIWVDANGFVGFGNGSTTPLSLLDVNGTITLRGSTSGYVAIKGAAGAGSTTYQLPSAAATVAGQMLVSDGSGSGTQALSWASATGGLLGSANAWTGTNTFSLATGIGTTSPGALLDIQGSTESLYLLRANGANTNAPNLRIRKARGTVAARSVISNGDYLGHITWEGFDGTNYIEGAGIWGISNGAVSTNNVPSDLLFLTNPGSAAQGTERMRITSTGNVGINTTTPLGKFSVGSGSIGDANLIIQCSTPAANSLGYLAVNNNGNYGALFGWDANFAGTTVRTVGATDALSLVVNNSVTAIRINSAANVGISTNSPNSRLEVNDGYLTITRFGQDASIVTRRAEGSATTPTNTTASGTRAMALAPYVYNSGYNPIGIIEAWTDSTITSTSFPGRLVFSTTATSATVPTERMRIDSVGNVGINTTTPSLNVGMTGGLSVNGVAGTIMTLQKSGSTVLAINGSEITTGDVGFYDYVNSTWNKAIQLRGGKVGIGTSTTNVKLEVWQITNGGTNVATSALRTTPQLLLKGFGGSSTYHSGIAFSMNEHTSGYWGSGILSHDDTGSYGSALTFYTSTGLASASPTEKMRITSSGNVGIGTNNPSAPLDISTPSNLSYNVCIQTLAPNLSAGNSSYIATGKANSTNNSISFNFYYAGAGSTSNRGEFTFWGGGPILSMFPTGNVGIGTTQNYSTLQVGGNVNDTLFIGTACLASTSGQSSLLFSSKRTDTAAPDAQNVGGIFAEANSGWVSKLHFRMNNNWGMPAVYAMTIYGSNIGIGTQTPGYQLQLSTDSAAKPTSNTWTISSDARVKTISGSYDRGLSDVIALAPKTYRLNGQYGTVDDGKNHVSIIAQDIEQTWPEMLGSYEHIEIDENTKEEISRTQLLSLNTNELQWALVNAIKELSARVIALESQLSSGAA